MKRQRAQTTPSDKVFQPRTLAALRLANGKTQMDVARAAGIANRMSVCLWEKEDSDRNPSEKQVARIAAFLGCSADVFYEEIDADFREMFTSDVKAFCLAAMEGKDKHLKRMALDMFKHLFPESFKAEIDVKISDATKQDDDLLEEGETPDVPQEDLDKMTESLEAAQKLLEEVTKDE